MTDWPPEWTEAAKAWRAERDKNDPIGDKPSLPPPPARCEVCHPGPCRFPTFCAAVAHAPPGDRTLGGRLPHKWWEMTDMQLGAWFDKRDAEFVAESTFWAIHYAITREGAPAFVRRYADIARFTDAQIKEMIRLLEKAGSPKTVIDSFREFLT